MVMNVLKITKLMGEVIGRRAHTTLGKGCRKGPSVEGTYKFETQRSQGWLRAWDECSRCKGPKLGNCLVCLMFRGQ